jgi:hypothetical protein
MHHWPTMKLISDTNLLLQITDYIYHTAQIEIVFFEYRGLYRFKTV